MTDRLRQMLIEHEGLKLFPYVDTVGKTTIGCGRNLTDRGITEQEAYRMLEHDIRIVRHELSQFTWWRQLNTARQDALTDMCFNLGSSRFRTFHKMIHALQNQDYDEAAAQALDSKWAHQVGRRAIDIANILRTGHYNDGR